MKLPGERRSAIGEQSVNCAQAKDQLCSDRKLAGTYGRIWLVQRNCQVATALMATDTMESETSTTDIFSGPLPTNK
jgi:hypothetical protein